MVSAPLPHFEDHDPSGEYGDPHGMPVRVGVLGDSTVTGPGLREPSGSWIAQLVDRLPWNVELCSHAKGGSRVRDVLIDQAPQAVVDPPDVFVVSVGANDVMHATPTRQFRRDLEATIEVLRAAAPVVTLGVGDLSIIPRMPVALRPLAAKRCVTIDRIHDDVVTNRSGVVRVPVAELSDPHFANADLSWFTPDLFHPNELGHKLWADLFRPYVHSALDTAVSVIDLRNPVRQFQDSGA